MSDLESVATTMQRDPMFSHDVDGKIISRERTCKCGKVFVQRLLSARFLTIVENQSRGAIAAVTRDIPDYFVPVHCPTCERKDLGHAERAADIRHGAFGYGP